MAPVRSARHPAAALLFVDWLLSRDGQQVLVRRHYGSVRKDIASASPVARKPTDVETLRAEEKRWSDRFDRLVRLGKAGPSSG